MEAFFSIFQHDNAQFHPCKTHPRILGMLIPSKWLSLPQKKEVDEGILGKKGAETILTAKDS